ncbi:hypothetical protein Pmani_012478 [Petrolisthes manimaculis]|uniref:Uncharacterized protein n=1 Tax=Petrolisthes manimaculis TaxID=1843537 RepID=A0AAE1PZ69_9EUCA|nr:hypothetical protein Pmani_012478 [Petrolisthes manimaculis]
MCSDQHCHQPLPSFQDNDRTLQDIRESAREDTEYVHLLQYVTSGFPSHRYELNKTALPYRKLRDSLYTDEELVLYGQRIVVPAAH